MKRFLILFFVILMQAPANSRTFDFDIQNQKSELLLFTYDISGIATSFLDSKIPLSNYPNKHVNNLISYSFEKSTPFYYKWWFILTVFVFLILFFRLAIEKTSIYNKDFAKDFAESSEEIEEFKTYFFFFGLLFPLTEVLNLYFIPRSSSELLINSIVGAACFLIYIISVKIVSFKKYIPTLFRLFLFLYTALTIYKVFSFPFDVITFAEFMLILFFSYSVFKKFKHYLFYMSTVFVILFILLINKTDETKEIVTLINNFFIILVINYARRIAILNTKGKILFSNNILNNSNSISMATDKFGNVTYCSDSVRKILGYKPEEVMGLNFWKLTEDTEFKAVDYNTIYKPDTIYSRKLKCKNGNYKYIQWTDQKHNDNLFVSNGQDVTDKIFAEEQYRNLIQHASDIIFETDKYGNFTFINQYTEVLLGYPINELLGKHFKTLIKGEYKEIVERHLVKIPEKTNIFEAIQFPIHKKNGEELWLSQNTTLKRNSNGKIIGYSAIARDITLGKIVEIQESDRYEKINRLNTISNRLSTLNFLNFESPTELIQHILKETSLAIQIERASLWNNYDDRLELNSLYIKKADTYYRDITLYKKDYPTYFNILEKQPYLLITDAQNSYQSKELSDVYLKIHNIKSLLDFPVYISGKLSAITCFEATEDIKIWTEEEINFAKTVSDIIALALETFKRKNAEELIIYKSDLLTSIAKMTEKLLQTKNLTTAFSESIRYIGETTKLDRFYYFENNPATQLISQAFIWASNQELEETGNRKLKNVPHDTFSEFMPVIIENKPYLSLVKNIQDEDYKSLLEKQSVLSILILPIFVEDIFHGFIAFEDCTTERIWNLDETNILQALANNISATVGRIHYETAIRESEEKFKLLANNIPAAVYLISYDEAQTKVYLNDQIEKLTGYSKDELYNDNIKLRDLYHPDDLEQAMYLVQMAIKNRKPYKITSRIIRKDGSIVWIEEYGEGIVINNNVEYLEGVAIDITERIESKKAIEEKEIAEKSNLAKTQFLANMSHEIRTPLNGIIGFSHLLSKTELSAVQKQYMLTVNQSADALLDIVNDILDLSKIEAGKLELDIQKTNLHDMVSQVIDMVKFSAHEKNLDLIINIKDNTPCDIWIDEIRMKQILINLLGNAIKFTSVGEIELEVQCNKIAHDRTLAKFSVKDTGIGIKAENQQKIFEVFSQEDNSTTRKYGGTGLGLPISNSLLSLMGSQLQIESNETGSIFFFEIEATADFNKTCEKLTNNKLKNILIAEGNLKNSMVLENTMRNFSIQPETVSSYELLIEKLNSNVNYDVFLLDYKLLGKKRLDEILRLKEIEDKPVIVMQNSNIGKIKFSNHKHSIPILKPIKNKTLLTVLNKINNPHIEDVIIKNIPISKKEMSIDDIKILIVEDNKINMLLSKTLIKNIIPKAIILEATNGQEAVELFENKKPKIILMDIQMPVMNGYEASEKIREKDKECVIIALTAGTFKGEREICFSHGMNDYITKPIEKEILENILIKWVKTIKS